MGIKVAKFGGSSLADENQFRKVKAIIEADPDRRYIVPSAPGKRFSEDIKITDMLYRCYDLAKKGENFDEDFALIEKRYNDIIAALSLTLSLADDFSEIKSAMRAKVGRDYAASRGEYLNGKILAEYLGYEFIDAAEVIFFDENGKYAAEHTDYILSERLKNVERAVIPGFYGISANDTIKTFSRGGSDITGAIVAKAAKADLYENWTDVSGFLCADPRIVKNPRPIGIITYRELRELSYMGATVLHEEAIFPVKSAGIPINIRNTNRPEDCGTMIVASVSTLHEEENPNVITGIAGKKNFSVITLEKDRMNEEVGFGRRVLEVLERHKICFEHMPSGIDTMSVVVDDLAFTKDKSEIIKDLFEETGADSIDVESGIALVAVAGHGMKNIRGTAAKIFTALAEANINIRMIDQGSSELNIIIGVNNDDFEESIRTIYAAFEN
ncbi:MAG: aspartate kinase [Ruminococcaceae bacterium]|nr:aspartate kinase [Oscillospiraceae bacterium]